MYSVAQRVIERIASAAGVTEAPAQPGSFRTLNCDLYQFPPADRTNTTVQEKFDRKAQSWSRAGPEFWKTIVA